MTSVILLRMRSYSALVGLSPEICFRSPRKIWFENLCPCYPTTAFVYEPWLAPWTGSRLPHVFSFLPVPIENAVRPDFPFLPMGPEEEDDERLWRKMSRRIIWTTDAMINPSRPPSPSLPKAPPQQLGVRPDTPLNTSARTQ